MNWKLTDAEIRRLAALPVNHYATLRHPQIGAHGGEVEARYRVLSNDGEGRLELVDDARGQKINIDLAEDGADDPIAGVQWPTEWSFR